MKKKKKKVKKTDELKIKSRIGIRKTNERRKGRMNER